MCNINQDIISQFKYDTKALFELIRENYLRVIREMEKEHRCIERKKCSIEI